MALKPQSRTPDVLVCRQTLKQSFPDKLWLDIFSKSDLLTAHFQTADALRQNDADSASPSQLLSSSSASHGSSAQHSLNGHPDDSSAAADLSISDADSKESHSQQPELQNHANVSHVDDHNLDSERQADTMHAGVHPPDDYSIATLVREEQEEWGGALDPATSLHEVVQAVLALPAALRISSVTQEGIESLQLATMELLSVPANSSPQQELTS